MAMANTMQKHQEIYKELELIKNGIYNNEFLNKKFEDGSVTGLHKIREIQKYYLDKYSYIKKYYGSEREYIRTNVIDSYVCGANYKQEVVSKNTDFLGLEN